MKIYKIIYTNDNKTKFKITEPNFVEKNIHKYRIVYKNKIYSLQSIFNIIKNNGKKIKFKLICYNKIQDINIILKYKPNFKHFFEVKKFKKLMIMYQFFDYFLASSREILRLMYKIDNEDKIQIFGDEYSGNNGNKCSIIYKDKIFPLQSYFLLNNIDKDDKKNKKFEILLLELEDISDRSYMLYICELIVEFANFEINKNKIDDNLIEETKFLDPEETNK